MYKLLTGIFMLGALFAGGTGSSYATAQHDQDGQEQGLAQNATHWSKTLTEPQRTQVDRMHHALDRILEPLKANEEQAHKQLNRLTIKDDITQPEINQTIDKLMTIKNTILRHRHAHLVEMRMILTDEQRVSYDAALLKRREIK